MQSEWLAGPCGKEGGTIFLCSHVLGDGGANVQSHGDHQRRKGAGSRHRHRIERTHESETLEDVFIRLVGHSIEEAERFTEDEGVSDAEE